ncbi:MAG: hypothetical protein JXK07_06605 [Spirochaetes bacterium]|nr:hypothetical protein [Spirochaetota bacterium]MBN2771614.1 hypothetical protein [Spirochaetota bacterium]
MKQRSPKFILVVSFLILIATGTALLSLPAATNKPISVMDALFTATSAVTVTGLIVLDTPVDFTIFGQAVILILIQMGGLGIMTFSLGLISLISRSLSIKWQFTLMDIYGNNHKLPILKILKQILIFTAILETFITVLLLPFFMMRFPFRKALWHSLFHAISSFCNAGFSTFSDSLCGFSGSYYLNIVISISIVFGGIGFLVIHDVVNNLRKKTIKKISVHTKIVLLTTILLILTGTIFFYNYEYNYILKNIPIGEKLTVSFFQSITCRTAGFNSIDIGKLQNNTLFFMIILMFIGGSPGSIAGGIKTTTLWVIAAIIISQLRRHEQIKFFNRAVSQSTAERATTLFILAMAIITTATLIVSGFEAHEGNVCFLDVLFEMSSAFGTVGLSTGITTELNTVSRIITIIVMLTGRLGPLTFLAVFSEGYIKNKIKYPEEHIMIG